MNEKTSIHIYPDLWAKTASLLQGLTVMQQCLNQMTFRNDFKFKKRLVKPGDTAANECRKRTHDYVRIISRHF